MIYNRTPQPDGRVGTLGVTMLHNQLLLYILMLFAPTVATRFRKREYMPLNYEIWR